MERNIKLDNVWKRYGQVEAVKGVNFECRDGEFFCLLGPSGAGKTSILKMVAGIEKVTSGNIFIGGRLVNELKPQERDVAMMFENYALYPHLTVFENLASPLRSPAVKGKYSSEEIKRTVTRVAEMLSIGHLLSRYPRQLSGGQKQRAALGRVLVRKASVFLLDEPISHLDAKLRHEMRVELKRIHREIRAAFVYATPDQLEAMSMADTIAVLREGVLQQVGTPDELYNYPANEFVAGFIGEPPMNFLDGELEEIGGGLVIRAGEEFEISVPEALASKLRSSIEGRGVRVGVRPTDLGLVATESCGESSLQGEVYVCEPLGRYTVITVKIGDAFLKVKVEGHFRVREKEKVGLSLDRDRLYFFDAQTGNALI
jgi:multiple sugar transport system ATP-binding protein